ncbi:HesB/YadR/YfhF family protein [Metabacillus fastidiosus]|uniref:HesB/YadR/YfhF family protein n=1 Tax=Metabacillus fastidiosus TaxID=1458 RepID=A0ABU6P0N6_9BACI|nr:HesB/YadR/YfhF family protein [Metabacillus fastidiosus]MED4402670.1 HesB/YadR/YfhF family protein [Metabacillus fastidiosus]MED4454845.1 HesB/YadR/YfhF family protein [Metabacillus fastidiosus]MED4462029.1 HesB/YadR/YfhF family protein [Metabacillus fastidiosus]
MELIVHDEAVAWYKDELDLEKGAFVRFFVRYGGCSTVQKGFSLGVKLDAPNAIGVSTVKEDITFYIDDHDLWYFEDNNLIVKYDEKLGEPEFHYEK